MMTDYKCRLCQSGCPEIIKAKLTLETFRCPTSNRFILFTLPKDMVPATTADFLNPNGSLRLNMPFLLYNTRDLYYVHYIDADVQKIEMERWVEIGNIYIKSEHKSII